MKVIHTFLLFYIAGLIIGALFYSCSAKAATDNCKTHKLYCKIMEFNPKYDTAEALILSNKIYAKAKKAGIDPNIALAILIQESGLKNIHTYKTQSVVTQTCKNYVCTKVTTETTSVFDMTVAQINIKTAYYYGFDVARLYAFDMDYALDCFMVVLKDKISLCAKLDKYPTYSCFHSINDQYRLVYADLVEKHK